jgi:methanogenic corrinoid protein MtbC1
MRVIRHKRAALVVKECLSSRRRNIRREDSMHQVTSQIDDSVTVLVDALLAGKREQAIELTQDIARQRGGPAAVVEAISPALRQIGSRWQCGDIDAASEHVATIVARDILATVQSETIEQAWQPLAPRVLTFAPQNERHELPVIMAARTLESMGWSVLNLGCDLPAYKVVRAARDWRADVVCMSVTTKAGASLAVQAAQEILEMHRPPELWVGGSALECEWFEGMLQAAGATFVGRTVEQLQVRAHKHRAAERQLDTAA